MLAPNSLRFILPFYLAYFVLGAVSLFYWWLAPVALIFLLIGVFMTYFFRDPERNVVVDPKVLTAPADGKIIDIKGDGLKDPFIVKIRMSAFDVHINRLPMNGKLINIQRIPGKHRPIYFKNPDKTNEKAIQEYETSIGKMQIIQITGIFARRIEIWVNVGEEAKQGQKIGMIRFGSETDLLIIGSKKIKPMVKIGDPVKAGISVVGRIL